MNGDTFSFIKQTSFRKNIVESVEFAAKLWIIASSIEARLQDEIVRTIVLYNASIIEALLLYRAKNRKITFFKTEYRQVSEVAKQFQTSERKIVIAFQEKIEREESQISLNFLIKEQESFLGKTLAKDVKNLQQIRNTFHLSKKRASISLDDAQESYDVVLKVVNRIRKEKESK